MKKEVKIMKKFTLKNILCFIISTAIICSANIFSVVAVENKKTEKNEIVFEDINSFRKYIIDLFDKNYDEFVYLTRKLCPTITADDKYITHEANCGPCTSAFQKILYDNGILTEAQKKNFKFDHVYNIYRTRFSSTPDKISTVIIDTTYKHYMDYKYISCGFTSDDLIAESPSVLVYEYGEIEQLKEQLLTTKPRMGNYLYKKFYNDIFNSHYFYEYLPQDLQYLGFKEIVNYPPEFVDKLANKSGNYDIKFNEQLFISSRITDLSIPFVYDNNGIYRCLIPSANYPLFTDGFTITNSDNKAVFGGDSENFVVNPNVQFAYNASENDVKLLKKDSNYPIFINNEYPYNIQSDVLVSIDFRAGMDSPALYLLPIYKIQQYGDVNSDGETNISDSTAIQKVLSGIDGEGFDIFETEAANVIKDGYMNVTCATSIGKHIVGFRTPKCDQKMYFSQRVQLCANQNYGYIDF